MEKRFKEDLLTYVFTTRFVIEDNSEITYATHDHDGDWQFMSNDEFDESDARVVSLEEILERDPTLLKLADLPLGYEASRNDKYSNWEINSIAN